MRTRIVESLAGLIILVMMSCAGSPTMESDEPEAAAAAEPAVEEVMEPEPVPVWKTAGETIRSPDGTIDKEIEYRYDDSGRISRITEKDARGELLYLRSFKYENGQLVSQEMSDRYGLVSMTLYENNAEGLVITETKKNAQGNNLSIVTFEYENDLVIRSVAADGSGTPHLSALYGYKGDIITSVTYLLPGGSEEARFERTLKSGRAVEEKTILPDGTVETGRRFEYEGGRLVREEQYAGSALTKSVEYDHDAEGNIIRETTYNRSGRAYEILERRWILVEEME